MYKRYSLGWTSFYPRMTVFVLLLFYTYLSIYKRFSQMVKKNIGTMCTLVQLITGFDQQRKFNRCRTFLLLTLLKSATLYLTCVGLIFVVTCISNIIPREPYTSFSSFYILQLFRLSQSMFEMNKVTNGS